MLEPGSESEMSLCQESCVLVCENPYRLLKDISELDLHVGSEWYEG